MVKRSLAEVKRESQKSPSSSRSVRKKSRHQEEDDAENESVTASQLNIRSLGSLVDFSVCGRVISIKLENFLCHENLLVEFDVERSNCFYIGGPNGSGKSALCAALNIGLGGRGYDNDRGSSLKSYIKHNESRAKIRIVLSNDGYGALERDKYGDRVIIERTLNVTAAGNFTSNYAIRASFPPQNHNQMRRERPVSNHKADLERILDTFDIQLANPFCWMTQNRSREFLQEMKPDKLYQLFITATDLAAMSKTYSEIDNCLNEYGTYFNNMKKIQSRLQEKRAKAEAKLSGHRKLNDRRRKCKEYGWLLAWLPVYHIHKQVEQKSRQMDEIVRAEQQLNTGRYETQITELQAQLGSKQTEIEVASRSVNEAVKEARLAVQMGEDHVQRLQSSVNECGRVLQEETSDFNLTRAEYIKAQEKNPVEDKRRLGEMNSKLSTLIQKRADLENASKVLLSKMDVQKNRMATLQPHLKETENEMNCRQMEARRCQETIDRIRATGQNRVARFHQSMPRLMAAIEAQAQNFKQKPVGPLGNYIELRDEKWALAVERALNGRTLCAFMCCCFEDQRLLKQLFRQCAITQNVPSVIVTDFESRPYNTHSNEPPSNHLTVMRACKIDNAIVRNCLIDQTEMESLLLIEDDDQARNIMNDRPPVNGKKAFTLSGAEVFSSAKGGTYRFYANQYSTQPKYLHQTNHGMDSINQYEDKLLSLQQQNEESKMRRNGLMRDVAQLRQAISTINTEHERLTEQQLPDIDKQRVLLERSIRELGAGLEQQTSGECLREEMDRMREAMEASKEKLAGLRKELNEAQIRHNEQKKDVQMAVERNLPAHEAVNKLKTEHEKLNAAIAEYREKLRRAAGKSQRVAENRQKLETELAQLREKKNDLEAAAKQCKFSAPEGHSNPPDLDAFDERKDNLEELREQYRLFEEELRVAERELGDPRADKQNYDLLVRRCSTYEELSNQLHQLHKRLQKSLWKRNYTYKYLRTKMSIQLRNGFQRLMTMKGLAGKISINHLKQELEISVETHARSNIQRGSSDNNNNNNNENDNENDNENESSQRSSTNSLQNDFNATQRVGGRFSKRSQVFSDLRGLSGGERSYTTACFIMALWETIEAPFRCMDEFDVFMDQVSRKIVMDLLVQLATSDYPNFQFIFFTPQGLDGLKKHDRVQVFQLQKR